VAWVPSGCRAVVTHALLELADRCILLDPNHLSIQRAIRTIDIGVIRNPDFILYKSEGIAFISRDPSRYASRIELHV
jgi:hypothetical protein